MAIHERLPRIAKPELRLMGWTKARELVKVARRETGMLGPDKSRSYCLEMICADFLAGAKLGETQQ